MPGKYSPNRRELLAENKQLKEELRRERSKERCYRCGGTGEIWTYWDGNTWCPHCNGSGRV